MTEPAPDLDERLARLAARKAGAARAPEEPRASAGVSGRHRRRRKHPAAAGRILSLGLSSSAFFAFVGAMGTHPPTPHTPVAATAPPAGSRRVVVVTKVVVRAVHHVEYVDQYGRPVPAALLAKSALPGSAAPTAGGGATPSVPPGFGSPSGRTTASPSVGAPPPASTPNSPPVAPGLPPATVQVSPPPSHTPATTPPVTAPPTVVTTPPPPPPACSGTKCP